MSVLQVLAAADDPVLDPLQHRIRAAYGAEDADALDPLVRQVRRDAVLDGQNADDEHAQSTAGAGGSLQLPAHEQLVADPGVGPGDPRDRLVVGVEDQLDAAADDVGAAGEQPLRDQDVDLAQLGGREVDADLLGLHRCSSQIPGGTLTDCEKQVKAGDVRAHEANRSIWDRRTRKSAGRGRTLRACNASVLSARWPPRQRWPAWPPAAPRCRWGRPPSAARTVRACRRRRVSRDSPVRWRPPQEAPARPSRTEPHRRA